MLWKISEIRVFQTGFCELCLININDKVTANILKDN